MSLACPLRLSAAAVPLTFLVSDLDGADLDPKIAWAIFGVVCFFGAESVGAPAGAHMTAPLSARVTVLKLGTPGRGRAWSHLKVRGLSAAPARRPDAPVCPELSFPELRRAGRGHLTHTPTLSCERERQVPAPGFPDASTYAAGRRPPGLTRGSGPVVGWSKDCGDRRVGASRTGAMGHPVA